MLLSKMRKKCGSVHVIVTLLQYDFIRNGKAL